MGRGIGPLCCGLAIMLSGCSDPSAKTDSVSQADIQEIKTDVEDIQEQVKLLALRLNLQNSFGTSVLLEPSDEGFSVLKTQFGTVTVTMDEIKPHGNSTRINLRFGNATSAALHDVTVKLDWGKADKDGLREAAIGSKEFKVLSPLRPGRWTTEVITLDRVTAQELAFVNVGAFQVGSIHLYK